MRDQERWERSHPGPGLAEGLQNTEVAVVPMSNPGVPVEGAPMKQRQLISQSQMSWLTHQNYRMQRLWY